MKHYLECGLVCVMFLLLEGCSGSAGYAYGYSWSSNGEDTAQAQWRAQQQARAMRMVLLQQQEELEYAAYQQRYVEPQRAYHVEYEISAKPRHERRERKAVHAQPGSDNRDRHENIPSHPGRRIK